MNLDDSYVRKPDPQTLLRLSYAMLLVALLVIMAMCAVMYYRIVPGLVTASVGEESGRLGLMVLDQQKSALIRSGKMGGQLVLSDGNLARIDREIRKTLAYFDVLKIRIYDADHLIIYSSEPAMIGRQDKNNPRLNDALAGTASSRHLFKERALGLSEQQFNQVDVVETFIPIFNEARNVVGSFEIHRNVTEYRNDVRKWFMRAFGVLCLVSLLPGIILYALLRRSVSRMAEMQAQLENMALTDLVTDVPTRAYTLSRGEEEFERVRRGRLKELPSAVMGCIMVDIDNLSRINDSYGHHTGDRVLKEVAQRIRSLMRPYDIMGRFGSEEFVVFLPDTNFDQTLLVAERVRVGICGAPCATALGEITVTVSLGVSSSAENNSQLNDLIKRSYEGVNKARSVGRNRVAWSYMPPGVS